MGPPLNTSQLQQFDPYWVMGYDTAKRWIEENKKADEAEQQRISQMKVIVVGRLSEGCYYNPRDLINGDESYTVIPYDFQSDISSTKIRESQGQNNPSQIS
jgi:hypothetical protein